MGGNMSKITLIGFLCMLGILAAGNANARGEERLNLKGTRIMVCSAYFDLLALPAVQRLKAAGAEVRPEGSPP